MSHPQRKPTRIKNYDYSQNGCYFITICTLNREHLFGKLEKGSVMLNLYGHIAENELSNIPKHFQAVDLDRFVIMPNHIHLILYISSDMNLISPTIPEIIGLYKSGVSKLIHKYDPDLKVWQRSFYDRVIRNEAEYRQIAKYIETNPIRWEQDEYR